jgi:hypothetical protein
MEYKRYLTNKSKYQNQIGGVINATRKLATSFADPNFSFKLKDLVVIVGNSFTPQNPPIELGSIGYITHIEINNITCNDPVENPNSDIYVVSLIYDPHMDKHGKNYFRFCKQNLRLFEDLSNNYSYEYYKDMLKVGRDVLILTKNIDKLDGPNYMQNIGNLGIKGKLLDTNNIESGLENYSNIPKYKVLIDGRIEEYMPRNMIPIMHLSSKRMILLKL